MAERPSRETLRDIEARREAGETFEEIGAALGRGRSTVHDWYRKYVKPDELQQNYLTDIPPKPAFTLPEFPDEDLPVEQIIDMAEKRFVKKRDSYAAHTWFEIKMHDNMPMGLCWFGDPHLDADGCDWPTLRRDVDLCKDTEGLYGANIGDTTNNWSGRLALLYASQEASVSTARKFAEWFMLDAGVQWLIWLLGNHDAWGDGSTVLLEMAKRHGTHKLVMHDWETRFVLVFPNGYRCRVYCAHDFKGSSIYNKLHGPMRESLMGDDADLYVCGHKHESGLMSSENAARGHDQHLLRVRGYKFMDEFARRHGYKEQRSGQSSISIIDPVERKVLLFKDVRDGAKFLEMRRAEEKA